MSIFFIVTGVISLCAIGLVLFPLFRRRSDIPMPGRGDYDIAVYQDQLKEVDRDLERNLLDQDQAEAIRTEIKRRMLDAMPQDSGISPSVAVPSPFQRRALIAAIVVLLPLGAFSLYFYLGVPGLPGVPFAERTAPAKTPVISDRDRKLLGDLAARMEKSPDNVDGWLLLGRSYSSLGLYTKAVNVYKRALKLAPGRVDIRSDYGEALVLAAKYVVSADAEEIFTGVLKTDPLDFRARYYLGLARAQHGDVAGAVQDWFDILAVAPKDAPWRASVKKVIAAAAKGINLDLSKLKPSAKALELAKISVAKSVGSPVKEPTSSDVSAINAMPKDKRDALILSMVKRLATRMENNPDDAEGWRRLARAYEVLGRTEDAKQARARADIAANAGAAKGKNKGKKSGAGANK